MQVYITRSLVKINNEMKRCNHCDCTFSISLLNLRYKGCVIMELNEVLQYLKDQSNPSRRNVLLKQGASETALGVPLGVVRKLAKEIGLNHDLGLALWQTMIVDAQLLSVMLIDGKKLSVDKVLGMIDEAETDALLDDLIFRCLVQMTSAEGLLIILRNSDKDNYQKVYWAFMVNELKKNQLIQNWQK